MKKQQYIFRTVLTILLTVIITYTITIVTLYGRNEISTTSEQSISKAIKDNSLSDKLTTIRQKINESYLGDVDENNLKEYSIKGYVAGLNDIYSQYYTANEMAEVTEETLGNFVGIGVYMTKDTENNHVIIYSVIKNSPAEEVGLKKNDAIVKVEDKEITDKDFEDVPSLIKGKDGTKVKITIERDGEQKEYEIERRRVDVINVSSQLIDNNIGYIKINSFEGDVASQFKDEYNSLMKNGAKTLIIDLRDNGGGLVDAALEIGEMFTNKNDILLIQKDKNDKEVVTKAKKTKEINNKVVILVNENTASASEILTAILKEDNAENTKIVGETTYGKGVIQCIYQLTDGSGLKITTDEYFTPKHNKINKVGIRPDIEIKNDEEFMVTEDIDRENDKQLQKAIEVLK